jgi:cytochrome c-type biogenesis protein CcmF
MIPELGTLALLIALVMTVLQATLGLVGAHRQDATWMRATTSVTRGVFVFVLFAFLILVHAFITHDYSIEYVAHNSNNELPLMYRIAAVWGAHEGSLLLWVFILSTWSLLVSQFSKGLPDDFRARVLGTLGLVGFGFLAFTIFTSSPFARNFPVPADGVDLNPILQDPALAAHPPMLYMGYVGTSVAFAFAVAAMLSGRMDAAWSRWTRPWTVAAWMCLTIGITLGSWWAYYELGWGGWWFWDPVENASFMPWLASTALIHSLAVTEKRGLFRNWTLLLAIFAFSLSLLGTFLVRSGVLVSVHSFAADPQRGLFVLGLLLAFIVGSLTLYAIRAPSLQSDGGFAPVSRESFLLLNNALLVAAAGLILLGTLWPLVMDVFELGKISVGPPYFNTVFLVPMLPLIALVGVGMHATWKRASYASKGRTLALFAVGGLVLGALIAFGCYGSYGVPLTIIGFGGGFFLMASSLWEPVLRAWRRQPQARAALGMAVAHFGIGLFVIGVSGVASYKIEKDVSMGPGDTTSIAGYDFHFLSTNDAVGPNYLAREAHVAISHGGQPLTELTTQKRQFKVQSNEMTHAGIAVAWNRDLFVALGDDLGAGKWSLRLQYKPLVRYIWLGGVFMALGGFIAILDRRYRRAVDVVSGESAAAGEG